MCIGGSSEGAGERVEDGLGAGDRFEEWLGADGVIQHRAIETKV